MVGVFLTCRLNIKMRAVIQRVSSAKVEVDNCTVGQIDKGLLVYLGVGKGDSVKDAGFIAEKIVNLRIFADQNDKMNLSVRDVGGSVLVISQFTLHGDCRKGRRPGFDASAEAPLANELYEKTIELIKKTPCVPFEDGINVATGIFGAHMHVTSLNDGPVTFLLDSSKLF